MDGGWFSTLDGAVFSVPDSGMMTDRSVLVGIGGDFDSFSLAWNGVGGRPLTDLLGVCGFSGVISKGFWKEIAGNFLGVSGFSKGFSKDICKAVAGDFVGILGGFSTGFIEDFAKAFGEAFPTPFCSLETNPPESFRSCWSVGDGGFASRPNGVNGREASDSLTFSAFEPAVLTEGLRTRGELVTRRLAGTAIRARGMGVSTLWEEMLRFEAAGAVVGGLGGWIAEGRRERRRDGTAETGTWGYEVGCLTVGMVERALERALEGVGMAVVVVGGRGMREGVRSRSMVGVDGEVRRGVVG